MFLSDLLGTLSSASRTHKPLLEAKIQAVSLPIAALLWLQRNCLLRPPSFGEILQGGRLDLAKRINTMAEILRQSKNLVKNLLRGDVLGEYLLVPGNLIKSSVKNNRNNATRQEILKAGREKASKHSAKSLGEWLSCDRETKT
jgi:hypothetical protein